MKRVIKASSDIISVDDLLETLEQAVEMSSRFEDHFFGEDAGDEFGKCSKNLQQALKCANKAANSI